ncbi:NB-ARC domain-containing protein [Leptolyngbya sp. Heron Island J]|uniref:WD40 domain-containing protein n=1 Tax=Leptolyngbya sp. Heron Island J TaxID=1385935 RepID=UPI00040C4311|nr:NB-ARC domain-containing protein [Leptolyngbya sp. Heron Island J]
MSRSLKVNNTAIQTVKGALKRCGFRSQRSLAEDLNMALSTISRFLNGKPVDFATFVEICDRLNLNWQTLSGDATETVLEPPSPLTSLAIQAPANGTLTLKTECSANARQQDWGEAIDTSFFHGRSEELARLQTAILTDKCRLVAILGIGGIGKTSLAAKLSHTIQSGFDAVIWRSVRNAPLLKSLLQQLVPFVSKQQDIEPTLERLFYWLRRHRCLIILDNVETLLESGQSGQYRVGYEDYGALLRQFSETAHCSCLVITSREKPSEIGFLESEQLLTRSFQLDGSAAAAQAIVRTKGLLGTSEIIQQFCQRYGNNPLAIKIVGTSIQSIFDGDISLFLQENAPIFNDFRRLLDQQFERLSTLEKSILYWLAVNREWTTAAELVHDIWPVVLRTDVFDALESLSWRSLIETKAGQYTQQPVIMEYVTDRLVQTVYEELETLYRLGQLNSASPLLFHTHALLKTTTKDYVRDSQRRMLLSPLAQRLQTTLMQPQIVKQCMLSVLASLRQVVAGYGAGNFINLCRQLKIDLTEYDFSDLAIWQADLLEASLKGVNFTRANFHHCQFSYHFGAVTALTLNSGNTLLAAGDLQGNIHIWETDTYQNICTINGHADGIFAIAFSPDSQYLVSGSSDTTIKLWQVRDYECVKTFQGHSQMVMSVAFSPDGKHIASASFDNIIKLWGITSDQCLHTLKGHTSSVRSLTFTTTGNILASASFDKTIKLWDWQQGKCITSLKGHTQGVWSLAFGPNDRFLVSGGDDRNIRVWEPTTGQCLKTLSSNQAVWFVTVSPDGKRLATGDNNGLIQLWNLESDLCEQSLCGHTGWLWSLIFSKDGNRLYSCGQDRTIRMWDLQNGYCVKSLSGYTNTVWSLAFSPDGQTLASGTHDGNIRLWNITSGKCVSEIPHNSPVFDVDFSSDGKYLVSGGDDITVKVWQLDNTVLYRNFVGHTSVVRSVAFHPHSHLVASAGADQTIKLWDIASNSCRRTLTGHSSIVWSSVFSHDAACLVTGSLDCSVKLWSVETGDCLRTFEGHSDSVFAVAFSADNSLLASTSSDATVKLWSVKTGQCLKTLTGHSNNILIGVFSPDGSIFASSELNGSIKIWDVDSGQCCLTLQAHNHVLWALAFSPNGQILASGGEGDMVKLWDTQSWQCLDTLRLPGLYEGINLTDATGLSVAQRNSLQALGAVSA